jgi:hypothetical protein
MHNKNIYRILIGIFACLLLNKHVLAGAPFLTNDPEPIPYKTWKLYVYSSLDDSPVATTTNLPATQIKISVSPDLELQTIIPVVNYKPHVGASAYGFGDAAIVFKYRFIHETNNLPQVAFHPIFEIPTGDKNRHLGNGRLWVKLPLFMQKSWGEWKTYGGGGYTLNSAPGKTHYPFGGCVLQRNINKFLMLGGEFYSQGRSATNIPSYTILNLGGSYQWTSNSGLLFSTGHNILGQRNTVAYLGIYWTGCS